MPKARGKKHFFVHLGNAHSMDEKTAVKTRGYVRRQAKEGRFSNVRFVGIDVMSVPHVKGWRQIRGDFLAGLAKLPDGSVANISSELSLGHYGPNLLKRDVQEEEIRQYTQKVVKRAHQKLRENGKLVVTGDVDAVAWVFGAMQKSGFVDIKKKRVRDFSWTPWLKDYAELMKSHGKAPKVYTVVGVKRGKK